jgi:hypothetical protein
MELAPYTACAVQVVKASSGHIPLPFLISDGKNWRKDREGSFYFGNFFLVWRMSYPPMAIG